MTRRILRLIIPTLPLLLIASRLFGQVLPGIDVLVRSDFAQLEGKRVGLVMNQTAVRRDVRQSTLDAFLGTDRCRLVALFAPEHGIDGSVLAGDEVGATVEKKSGLPIFSLYGATRRPTRAMLKDVDVMVYDIQDIGVRSYTFISTLIRVMEGCADAGIPLVVLDRPDPIGGDVVDGPVLDTAYRSFVGIVPVPYVYGLTVGELAEMANDEGWLEGGKKCDLEVIRMEGWRRSMSWRETGLTWVPPSPNIPTAESGFAYAVTGAIGELGIASIGVGFTLPFQLVGSPLIDGDELADRLNQMKGTGIYFRRTVYKPFYGMSTGKVCNGVQIMRTGDAPEPFTACVAILTALRDLYPERHLLDGVSDESWKMFDKVCGGPGLREDILAGKTFDEITASWHEGMQRFIARRENYLLYE
jgi:uncharacterized protein YbbC (DUF1343 family)